MNSIINALLHHSVLLITATLLLYQNGFVYAQKPINGNGIVVEQVRPMSQFRSISLDFTAKLVVVNGETPSFQIEAEENLLAHIGTRVRGGTLYISQDRWIESTRPILIRVGTPFTSGLETSGYSDVVVENIKGPRMQLTIGVGKATLMGSADRIQIRTKTGEIDARELQSYYADVTISSHGKVLLGAVDELVTDVVPRSTVVYDGSPSIKNTRDKSDSVLVHADNYVSPESVQVEYVALTLVNNSRKKVDLRVEGPRERNFSYGFTMRSSTKRREDWPVGTRLYMENALLSDELLLTITPDMESQQVSIFSKE